MVHFLLPSDRMRAEARLARAVGLSIGLLVCSSRVSLAQQLGVRTGASGDPGQFYVGGHVETGPIIDRLVFRPNIEVGFGNDTTLVGANVEFAYKIRVPKQRWTAYVGGGPALNIYRRKGETSPDGGFNVLFGAEHQRGLFAEIKAGLGGSPGFKFGVGYTFPR